MVVIHKKLQLETSEALCNFCLQVGLIPAFEQQVIVDRTNSPCCFVNCFAINVENRFRNQLDIFPPTASGILLKHVYRLLFSIVIALAFSYLGFLETVATVEASQLAL